MPERGTRRRRWPFVAGSVLALLATAFVINRTLAPLPGWAFPEPAIDFGGGPLKVGSEVVAYFDPITLRDGGPPITIRDIEVTGMGVGSVIEVVRVELGHPVRHVAPGGLYPVYPPAWECDVQPLVPVEGTVLREGEDSLLAVWFRLKSEGEYRVSGYTITYERFGLVFREHAGNRMSGEAAADGIVVSPEEFGLDLDCLAGKVRVLPDGS
jgi:hypothetical protein